MMTVRPHVPTYVRPPFDPELAVVLAEQSELVVVGLTSAEIPGLRERTVVPDPAALTRDGAFVQSVHRAPAAVPGGPEVTILLLMPAGATGPVACLFHLHGGGLVTGSAYDDVVPLTELAARTGCAIASVEYRLAPEHPYPAALDDAYSGLVWLAGNAEDLGIDAQAIVIEGISAGGGLAAATALLARDLGGPVLAGQLLVCPMLDDRNDSPSAHQMVGHGAWDRTANATAWTAYLPQPVLTDGLGGPRGIDGRDADSHERLGYASPARATSLAGLPPTFLDVGSAETFRDEVVAYAGRIWLDGGQAELHVWPGGFHGFDYLAPRAAVSQDAREARARWLGRLLRRRAADSAGPSVTA